MAMATSTAPVAPNGLAQAAASKPYDPIKAVEGMFNGCLTRLGYVLKDPKNYGDSTPYVLAECSKRFQDALDDCEITILNAKWYLEQKLAESKSRRDAAIKAQEVSTASAASKRKHEEMSEASEPQPADTPTKRAKSSDQPSPKPSSAVQNLSNSKTESKPAELSQQPIKSETETPPVANTQASAKDTSKPSEQEKLSPDQKKQEQPPQSDSKFNVDDYAKPSPPPTSALTNDNEDFFESMFNDPIEDSNDMNNANDDIDLDFLNDDFNPASNTNNNNAAITINTSQTQAQSQPQPPSTQQASLSSILPGLEQYANQPDDTASGKNANNQLQDAGNNPFTTDFEPNIFDSMLNDSLTFGGDTTDFADVDVGNPNETTTDDFDDIFGDFN